MKHIGMFLMLLIYLCQYRMRRQAKCYNSYYVECFLVTGQQEEERQEGGIRQLRILLYSFFARHAQFLSGSCVVDNIANTCAIMSQIFQWLYYPIWTTPQLPASRACMCRIICRVEHFPHMLHKLHVLPPFDDTNEQQLFERHSRSHHVSVVMSSGAVESLDKWATFPHRFPQLLMKVAQAEGGQRVVGLGLHPPHFPPVPRKGAEVGGGVVEGRRRSRRWGRRIWRGGQCQG